MKRKVAFHTLGCKLNFAETSTMARTFPDDKFERVSDDSHADIYVINTCTVTDTADRKCRQAVRKFVHRNPDAFIAVVGCYAQLRREEAASIEGVDLVLGTYEKFDIASYIDNLQKRTAPEIHSCETVDTDGFMTSWSAGDRTRSFLKVQDGCDYHCSYCTVPLARGKSRNPAVSEIVAAAEKIVAGGVMEIVLTGVNVGDFGKSTGESLGQLLESLTKVNGLQRLRLSSIEPNLVTDRIIDIISEGKVLLPHFHMPLQSGNDRVLGLMRRRYRREVFRDRVMKIRERIPDAGLGADVIVGFPGETEEDYADTYTFLESLPLSYLHVFAYSPRPGTPAAEMPGAVNRQEKEKRSRQLIRLSESRRMQFMRNASGEVHEVLFEKRGHDGTVAGLTGNYIRVMTPWVKGLPGSIRQVRLTTLRDDSSMNCELTDKEAQ
ncbi:MAG TPA: tRNA (N(6)-L-threonylcarbamoyladenosine(37)-C(2))-methylthiotransferase MtaB [Bacteroidales bacterium]|nr:tRNA (N(6)-L-threonylcarbamoyladenosine(37)-C(2))-methylthiotransferase MtaB [Bacteroidales bacterium]HNX84110.1 tRNA (N(6)-L-threonylcarbamoyladenosine(37)-C(2))-methylthiotransferase MtaB [Bacteroidales bacterium]HPS98131.1 tRNA (N(6)-L-threonylcarbamoyladenosine(37)-C(2))-methylthiotransferase MtaB [Bacteroidales bacterium]HQL46678.1 tRNA (N(6)-L-threonylcarbamoyladenosine(37)-C(2))-methylthiotransferase MtaB [Bacteroidales bacterium]